MKNKIVNNIFLKSIYVIFTLLFQFKQCYAADSLYKLDIYGTKLITSQQIEKYFKKELSFIANTMKNDYGAIDEKRAEGMFNAMKKILDYVQSTGKFASANVAPVIYSNFPTIYITLDVVEKSKTHQLQHFLPKPTKSIPEPNHMISSWIEYENLGRNLIYSKKEHVDTRKCSAHHCIYGFEHPQLKKYQQIFDQAEKNKLTLADILHHDKNGEKRAAAAYLLAHIKSKEEVVQLILPSISDANPNVRNNILRVLMMIAETDNKISLPLDKIIAAVDYPNTTDRNKSLCIISALANNPANAKQIKTQLATQLINNLKLLQPINHVPAYQILKKISGKNYGERDYQAWENWLKQ